MPSIFPTHSLGDILTHDTDWNNSFSLIENSFLDLGPYVVSGLGLSAGAGLVAAVAAGTAIIGAEVTSAGFNITGLTDNALNHLWMLQNGTGSHNTSGTPPANSVKLGTATTSGGVVTSVAMGRGSGRQQIVRPDALVPGGPAAGLTSAGHPGSINLAQWAAAAGEGVPVYGVLPGAAAASPLYPFTAPVPANFSWINQGAATLSTPAGGLTIQRAVYSGATLGAHIQAATAPATPYVRHAYLAHPIFLALPSYTIGICAVDSVNTLMVSMNMFQGNVVIQKWNAGYVPSTTYLSQAAHRINWMAVGDDGTNLAWYLSGDGTNWTKFFSAARHDFLTAGPDKIGFFVYADDTSGMGIDTIAATLFSWA